MYVVSKFNKANTVYIKCVPYRYVSNNCSLSKCRRFKIQSTTCAIFTSIEYSMQFRIHRTSECFDLAKVFCVDGSR